MSNIKVATGEITFRIDVIFENCDVDMVYKEMMAAGMITSVPSILCDSAQIKTDKSKMKYTPTRASVDFCLSWLHGYVDRNTMEIQSSKWDTDFSQEPILKETKDGTVFQTWPTVKTELEELGVKVTSTYSLIMGCCHLICVCDYAIFNEDLLEKANKIVKDIFDRFCKFY